MRIILIARLMNLRLLCVLFVSQISLACAAADVIDDCGRFQEVVDQALLDLHGGRWSTDLWQQVQSARASFGKDFSDPGSLTLWTAPLGTDRGDELSAAMSLGCLRARLQHAAALEMLALQWEGQVEAAREWRTIIKLPKYANSVEGTLALQRLGGNAAQRDEVNRLLAREYVIWQITRAR
jgi:high-affinity iron transporter